MKKQHLLKTLCTFVVMLLLSAVPAAAATYYATAEAYATGVSQGGKVCVSASQNPATSSYDYHSKLTNTGSSSWSTPNISFHIYAQAEGDAIFRGWYTNEACTSKQTDNAYFSTSIRGNRTSPGTTNTYYALFVYHYFAKANAHVVGEGGAVSVNSSAAGTTASAVSESGDITTQSNASVAFNLSAAATDRDHYFAGWYSDPECTNLVSDQPECTVSVTADKTNEAAAEAVNYYAKFAEVVRTDYTFTLVANPAHFTAIIGGEEGRLSALEYSAEGTANVSNATPEFTLQITPAADVIYSVKVYNGNELLETLALDATGAAEYSVSNENLNGARFVIESREGWFLTVKADPSIIPSLTGNGQPLAYSAEGVRHEFNISGNYEVAYTTANDDVLATLRFYNAAGETVYMPFQDQKGAQSASIDLASIKGGRIEVTGLVLGEDTPYFILKANPAHFKSMKAGIGTSTSNATYNIDLRYSEEGEINIFPEMESTQSLYYYFTPADDLDVEYTITYFYTDGTAPYAAWNNRTTYTTASIPKPAKINGGVVDVSSVILMPEGTDWWFTIKADPDLLKLRDYANGNAEVQCSLGGIEYHPAGRYSQIQMQGKVAESKTYNAYFYKADADINDPDQAFLTYENINVKNTTSWLSPMQKKVSNTNGHLGTLVIKNLVGVGTGNVTINISGTAGNVKVTNAGKDVTGLKVGENTVALEGAILSFTHKTNGSYLASVMCNGVELKPLDTDGNFSYTNKFAADGDVYEIVTDYSNTEYDVYIEVPEGCASFVTEVTVDGTAVTWTNGQPLKVKEGKTVRVQGDKFNYIVNAVTIDGEPQLVNNSASKQVLGETHIVFDVTYINRDKTFTFEIGSDAKGDFKTALNSFKEVSSTSNFNFCDADNPINFGGECTSNAQKEWVGVWTVNGEIVATGVSFPYSVNDNDVIRLDFKTDYYNVNFTRCAALTSWPQVVVKGEEKTPKHMVLQKNDKIVISSTAFVEVTEVNVIIGDETTSISADGNGDFNVPVSDDCTIEIIGEMKPVITLKINGDPMNLYIADGDNEYIEDLEEGENILNLAELAEGPIMITNFWGANNYYVSAISLNGTSIYRDDDYYIPYLNGGYVIDVQPFDYIEVTVSEMVRDRVLNLYIDGFDGMHGCFISDKFRNVPLVKQEDGTLGSDLQEGRNEIHFCDVDLPLVFWAEGLADANSTLAVILENEVVEYDEENGGYFFECSDGQSLYVNVLSSVEEEAVVVESETGMTTFASHNDIVVEAGEEAVVRAYIATGFDEETNKVEFVRVTGTIPAGTGLVLMSTDKSDFTVPVAKGSAFRAPMTRADGAPVDFDNNLLVPAYKYVEIPAADEEYDRYIYTTMHDEAGFHKVTSAITSDSNQAYLVLPKDQLADNEEHPLDIQDYVFSDPTATGIENVSVDETSQAVYNLYGVKVANSLNEKTLTPGIYISAGRKVVVRN